MKPLLRAVLVINALIFLAFGVLFLLTPWTALWASMHLVTVQPPFVGQLFGIALIGIAWLAVHAAIDGALTATAAKVSGHVEWLSGLVMMVWLLGLRTPELTGFGQVIAALVGVAMLVLGLGSVRLSGAVRRRERAALAGAAAAGAPRSVRRRPRRMSVWNVSLRRQGLCRRTPSHRRIRVGIVNPLWGRLLRVP
jgi:hypothetical protein